jgi:16S rRNA (cytosine1402-N4)-methyltransferase
MHRSVLLQEVIDALAPKEGGVFVDGTFGGGGHSEAIAARVGSRGRVVSCDADEGVFTQERISTLSQLTQFTHVVKNFRHVADILRDEGIKEIDGALFDLGLSSTQLEESGRGFSFQRDEPLEMTYRRTSTKDDVTAYSVVNLWSAESLATILRGFSDERFAKSIAEEIVRSRAIAPIERTHQLVEIIMRATPKWYQRGRSHVATRTFQAIRMAVNDELGVIGEAVRGVLPYVLPGGHIAIITFHSTEDRLVKQLFRELSTHGEVRLVHKKPVIASENELETNPRARSAKLRVIQKM